MTKSVVSQRFHLAISSVLVKRSLRAGGDKGSSQTRVEACETDGIGAPTMYEMKTVEDVGRVLSVTVTVSGVSETTRVMQVQTVSEYSTAPVGMNIRQNKSMQPTLTEQVVTAAEAPVVNVQSVMRIHVMRLSSDYTGPIWRKRYSTVVRQLIKQKCFAVQSRQPHVKSTIG